MATITATSRGQITLRKEYLKHMGILPGEKLDVEMLPGGRLLIQSIRSQGRIEDFFGCLAGKTTVRLSIEEMNDAITQAGAEAGLAGIAR